MIKFPREENDTDWVISVPYLRKVMAEMDDDRASYLSLEEIEAVLLALESMHNENEGKK